MVLGHTGTGWINGICIADDHGGNTWKEQENSKHSYLVLDIPREEMQTEIEAFMLGNF